MRDNEKEDARKRGGGADKRGGAHSRYQFFRCGKMGGGRINDGGRSGGTLRYMKTCLRTLYRRLLPLEFECYAVVHTYTPIAIDQQFTLPIYNTACTTYNCSIIMGILYATMHTHAVVKSMCSTVKARH